MPRVVIPQGPVIHLSTDRKAVECVVAMAAAVSACVTFLPYQTLTQSGVGGWGGGEGGRRWEESDGEISPRYVYMLAWKNASFNSVFSEFPTIGVKVSDRGSVLDARVHDRNQTSPTLERCLKLIGAEKERRMITSDIKVITIFYSVQSG